MSFKFMQDDECFSCAMGGNGLARGTAMQLLGCAAAAGKALLHWCRAPTRLCLLGQMPRLMPSVGAALLPTFLKRFFLYREMQDFWCAPSKAAGHPDTRPGRSLVMRCIARCSQ